MSRWPPRKYNLSCFGVLGRFLTLFFFVWSCPIFSNSMDMTCSLFTLIAAAKSIIRRNTRSTLPPRDAGKAPTITAPAPAPPRRSKPPPPKKTVTAKKTQSSIKAPPPSGGGGGGGAASNVEVFHGPPDEPLEGGWPPGWTKKVYERAGGDIQTKGRQDRYWYTPGHQYKLRSLVEVKRFIQALQAYSGDETKAFSEIKKKK
jgi:hypothetical protein